MSTTSERAGRTSKEEEAHPDRFDWYDILATALGMTRQAQCWRFRRWIGITTRCTTRCPSRLLRESARSRGQANARSGQHSLSVQVLHVEMILRLTAKFHETGSIYEKSGRWIVLRGQFHVGPPDYRFQSACTVSTIWAGIAFSSCVSPDCLVGQAAIGCHGRLSRRIALRIVISLRATATRAMSFGFPAVTSLSRKFLSCGL